MKPITRIESLLAQIEGNTSGNAVELDIEPVTKIEKYLASIAANTASGGSSSEPDMVILCTDYTGMWSEATFSLESGTYADTKAKLTAHTPVRCLLMVEVSETEEMVGIWGEYDFDGIFVGSYGGTEYIQLTCKTGEDDIFLYVLPDDTVTPEWPLGGD